MTDGTLGTKKRFPLGAHALQSFFFSFLVARLPSFHIAPTPWSEGRNFVRRAAEYHAKNAKDITGAPDTRDFGSHHVI